jgi:hypothetical protein
VAGGPLSPRRSRSRRSRSEGGRLKAPERRASGLFYVGTAVQPRGGRPFNSFSTPPERLSSPARSLPDGAGRGRAADGCRRPPPVHASASAPGAKRLCSRRGRAVHPRTGSRCCRSSAGRPARARTTASAWASDPIRGGVRDASDEMRDLERLLDRARLTPPYVLVGHRYPEDRRRGARRRQRARMWRRVFGVWPTSLALKLRRTLIEPMVAGVDDGAQRGARQPRPITRSHTAHRGSAAHGHEPFT